MGECTLMQTRKLSYEQAKAMVDVIKKGKLFKKPEDIIIAWKTEGFVDIGPKHEVEIELNESDMLTLCMIAHKKNITLNELAEEILSEYICHNTGFA